MSFFATLLPKLASAGASFAMNKAQGGASGPTDPGVNAPMNGNVPPMPTGNGGPPNPPPPQDMNIGRHIGQKIFKNRPWLASLAEMGINKAGDVAFDRFQAREMGRNTRRFNQEAFPGTQPWEQMGTGAAGAMAQAEQLDQREKESVRASKTTLQQTRIQSSTALATELYRNGGNETLPLVEKVLKASGALDVPGQLFDPRLMTPGKISAELGHIKASTWAAYAAGKQSLSTAQLNNIEAELRPVRLAFEEWKVSTGGSKFVNIVRSFDRYTRDAVNYYLGRNQTPTTQLILDYFREETPIDLPDPPADNPVAEKPMPGRNGNPRKR